LLLHQGLLDNAMTELPAAHALPAASDKLEEKDSKNEELVAHLRVLSNMLYKTEA
jgi:hypothetical protein